MAGLLENPFLMFRYPFLLFLASLAVLSLAAWLGARGFKRLRAQVAEHREDYRIVEGATLTLLGLIIGFTFSMALNRYDQRKNYEEAEANAIGTEYLRASLLPAADAARVRALLLKYIDQRVLFYKTRDAQELARIDAATAKLQSELWSAVQTPAAAQPTPIVALAVAGMNDVLNTQGYTQAAWLNRIPLAAWMLMFGIGVCAAMMVGIGAERTRTLSHVLLILPFILSIAFFLIADIDAPRRGIILVAPQNLELLAESLRSP